MWRRRERRSCSGSARRSILPCHRLRHCGDGSVARPPTRCPEREAAGASGGGSTIGSIIDLVLHLDTHLGDLAAAYGVWIYALLFLIVFCETGLVITPFLPGDSLLFAVGAVASTGALEPWFASTLLVVAAILGDSVNYWIGRAVGPRVFQGGSSRLFNRKHLERTHHFYEKHGGKTIVLARFLPIIRTFAPFVAGIGRMNFGRFAAFNVGGGILWVSLLVTLGYFFGSIPAVQENFALVILAIIVLSVLPGVVEWVRHRRTSP